MRTRVMIAAIVALGMSTMPVLGKAIPSRFDSDVDGWTVNHDGVGPVWVLSGNNGLIEGQDQPVGETWFFVAPDKFLGDMSAFYGGTLSFRLRQSNDQAGSSPEADVVLSGQIDSAAVRLVADILDPGYTWNSFTLPLAGGENTVWHVQGINGPLASRSDVLSVLSTLSGIWIQGECDYGTDWARLDDVILQTFPDINGDGYINIGDLQVLVAAWASLAGPPPSSNWNADADCNGNGYVNVGDLQILVANWGRSLN